MKKASILSFIMILCLGMRGFSAMAEELSVQKVKSCLAKMPPVVLVSQDIRDMNFSKSQRVDALWDYESTEKGKGVAQYYENAFCLAKLSVYTDNAGRISNNKVQRALKDKTAVFPFYSQKNLKAGKFKFYGVYGVDEDISNTLLLSAYKNNFVKIRVTCSVLPRFSSDEYNRKINEMTTIFTEGVSEALEACF